MKMVCFVILHYLAKEETVKCVAGLKKLKGEYKIIVVDNGSPNGSGKELQKLYENDPDIMVYLNSENAGFAQGNNLGCKIAKEKYDPDFYVVINNDVEIHQNDFIELVEKMWEETTFDILGPDIYCDTMGVHQSPKSLRRTCLEDSVKLKKKYERKVKSKIMVPLRCYAKRIQVLNSLYTSRKEKAKNIDHGQRYADVPLHGSCLIFTRQYMDTRATAFFPGTFFYYESEILDYEAQLHNYKVLYAPEMQVIHHHNVSTNLTYKNELEKVRFMNEQNYRSISKFIERYGG